jgi:hypothetical protein
MRRNFDITGGIYLSQPPHELDLHNNFDFLGLEYSIEDRMVTLRWRRAEGEWVPAGTPASVAVTFAEVSEFRFEPRDAALPFTEDDCMNAFGYWTDEDWVDGIIVIPDRQEPEPHWLTAVEFMSGARILVQATSANAVITTKR